MYRHTFMTYAHTSHESWRRRKKRILLCISSQYFISRIFTIRALYSQPFIYIYRYITRDKQQMLFYISTECKWITRKKKFLLFYCYFKHKTSHTTYIHNILINPCPYFIHTRDMDCKPVTSVWWVMCDVS